VLAAFIGGIDGQLARTDAERETEREQTPPAT
jgi:hypothetical protein